MKANRINTTHMESLTNAMARKAVPGLTASSKSFTRWTAVGASFPAGANAVRSVVLVLNGARVLVPTQSPLMVEKSVKGLVCRLVLVNSNSVRLMAGGVDLVDGAIAINHVVGARNGAAAVVPTQNPHIWAKRALVMIENCVVATDRNARAVTLMVGVGPSGLCVGFMLTFSANAQRHAVNATDFRNPARFVARCDRRLS